MWARYHREFADLERAGALVRPSVPQICAGNAHIYYVIMPSVALRGELLRRTKAGRHRAPCSTTFRSTMPPAGPPLRPAAWGTFAHDGGSQCAARPAAALGRAVG